jgi:hypothetical protein
MKYLYILFISFSLIGSITLHAQYPTINISFQASFNEQKISLEDSAFMVKNNEIINIETLKFYVSNIRLYNKEKQLLKVPNSFHLIDLAKPTSQNIIIKNPKEFLIKTIEFDLGIDSVTNVSGVFGGDLDPTKGMYWTWQSGYINLKLEGKCATCSSKDKGFQFHLGGYTSPFNNIQKVVLKLSESTNELIVGLPLDAVFSKIDLKSVNQIMSPNQKANTISKIIAESFLIFQY